MTSLTSAGRKQAVVDHARGRVEPAGRQRGRVADLARRSRRSRRRRGCAGAPRGPRGRRAAGAASPARPKREQLHRDRAAQGSVDRLARVGDDDEALGRGGHDLLAACARRRRPSPSQPSGATWSAPSIAMSRRSMSSNGSTCEPERARRRARSSVTMATQRSGSATRAPAPGSRKADGRAGARHELTAISVLSHDRERRRLGGDALLGVLGHDGVSFHSQRAGPRARSPAPPRSPSRGRAGPRPRPRSPASARRARAGSGRGRTGGVAADAPHLRDHAVDALSHLLGGLPVRAAVPEQVPVGPLLVDLHGRQPFVVTVVPLA